VVLLQLFGFCAATSVLSAVNLATRTMRGSVVSTANMASGGSETDFNDTATFNIPGATAATVTSIGIPFNLDGTLSNTSGTTGASAVTDLVAQVVGAATYEVGASVSPDGVIVQTTSGWLTATVGCDTSSCFGFQDFITVVGANPQITFNRRLSLGCGNGPCDVDYSDTAAVSLLNRRGMQRLTSAL
jgi:hypothetical protein